MGVASGCGYQEVGVASGSGWNLWVWLVGGMYGCATLKVWMTIVESGWNVWVCLVGVVIRRWVWLVGVGGIYG